MVRRLVHLRVPAGVEDGNVVRLKQMGGVGRNGGLPGDLFVKVQVRQALC